MSMKTEAVAQTAKELALAAIAGSATIYLLTLIPVSGATSARRAPGCGTAAGRTFATHIARAAF